MLNTFLRKMSTTNINFILKCINNSERSIKLVSGQKAIFKADNSVKVCLDDNELYLLVEGPSFASLNGFKLSKGKKNLELSDCLTIGEDCYEILDDTIKRKRSESPPMQKKQKIANDSPVFGLFKKGDSKDNVDGIWDRKNKDLLVFTPKNIQHRMKIAGFDLDGTLIKTKSGNRFATDDNDWVLNFANIPKELEKCIGNDFKCVIFTNQLGLGKQENNIPGFKQKIENIVKQLGIPIQIFASLQRSINRKPAPGMWDALIKDYNADIEIDLNDSFYVGDAAGRIVNWAPGKKKDFSCSDRLFALNLKLSFSTPEEFFLNQAPAKFELPKLNPIEMKGDDPDFEISDDLEIVVMVGSPGSGKSLLAKTFLAGYTYVNRDTLGSWQACVKKLEQSIEAKQSVVVDNVNKDKESRLRYIDVAKKFKIPCRCFFMDIDKELAMHNNRFRELTDKSHAFVSDIIIHSYYKSLEVPTVDEGFSKVHQIKFLSIDHKGESKRLYKMFLNEK